MPRGNDTQAHAEFAGQYGGFRNAEDLIEAHHAAMSPAVKTATLKARDDEASDTLDLSKIQPSHGGVVLSASVRGGQILYAAEGSDGRVYKDVAPYTG